MLTVTTTDKQIFLQVDNYRKIPYYKGQLRFRLSDTGARFYVYLWLSETPFINIWMNSGITINGQELTPENMDSLLEDIGANQCGAVTSVNGKTGAVVLTLDDIALAGPSTLLPLGIGEASNDNEAATLGQAKAQAGAVKEYTDGKLNQSALFNADIGEDPVATGKLRFYMVTRNLGSGAQNTTMKLIREASASQNGLQSADNFQLTQDNAAGIEDLELAISGETEARHNAEADLLSQIENNATRISELQGRGGALPFNDFGQFSNPLTAAQKKTLTTYAISYIWPEYTDLSYDNDDPAASTFNDASGNPHTAAEIFNSTWVRNSFDNHRFVLANTQDTTPKVFDWTDVGVDTVSIATDDLAGIVKGTEDTPANNGGITVQPDGTQKVIGWNAKMDKNTGTSPTNQAYIKNTDGTQAMCGIDTYDLAGTLALRDNNGNAHFATPISPTHAATKGYVDGLIEALQESIGDIAEALDVINGEEE